MTCVHKSIQFYRTSWTTKWNISKNKSTMWLTPSAPALPHCCYSKGSVSYWSNLLPVFLIYDIQVLWHCWLMPISHHRHRQDKTVPYCLVHVGSVNWIGEKTRQFFVLSRPSFQFATVQSQTYWGQLKTILNYHQFSSHHWHGQDVSAAWNRHYTFFVAGTDMCAQKYTILQNFIDHQVENQKK